jgi:transposase
MLTLPPTVRIVASTGPTDLRKGFDGLSALVTSRLQQDPVNGSLYVFHNRRRNQVRVLFWDRTGFAIFAKKLARGTFHFTVRTDADGAYVEMEAAELALVLEGIDLREAKRHRRWRLPKKAA